MFAKGNGTLVSLSTSFPLIVISVEACLVTVSFLIIKFSENCSVFSFDLGTDTTVAFVFIVIKEIETNAKALMKGIGVLDFDFKK